MFRRRRWAVEEEMRLEKEMEEMGSRGGDGRRRRR